MKTTKFFQEFGQEFGWVIDYIAMFAILFIATIIIANMVPPNYALTVLMSGIIISLIISFMVYCYDESGVRESVIITTLVNVVRKLLSIPKPEHPEQIITRKT